MNPATIALWALSFAQAREDMDQLIDKTVAAEPKVDHIVADAYAAAVREHGKSLGTSLDEKVDKLALICRAMWELVSERCDLSDEDLLKKVKEIDLSDGLLDGKVNIAPKACSECGRPVSRRHARCIYCGAEALTDMPFNIL